MKKVLLLLSVLAVLFLAGCGNNENAQNNVNNNSGDTQKEINTNVESGNLESDNTEIENVQSGEVEENVESGDVLETPSGEAETSVLTNEFLSQAEWVPVRAFNLMLEEEVALQTIYGSSYLQYGAGSIKFNNDGTFSAYLGITDGTTENYEGTYTINGADEVNFKYLNGNEQKVSVTEINDKYVLSFEQDYGSEKVVIECEQK